MKDQITLTIDGQTVRATPDATIMEVADAMGLSIPRLCYHPHLTPNTVCRLCVVEWEGARTLVPACVARVREGAVIHTASPRVQRARRVILELLASTVDLSESPTLLAYAQAWGADLRRFEAGARRQFPLYDDNPFYVRDYNKCVLCWRCVQTCADDLQYTYALTLGGRGFHSHITTAFNRPMPETTCVFCGNCVAVCPTGALKGKVAFLVQQGTPVPVALWRARPPR